jgi:CBS domain-containing protein
MPWVPGLTVRILTHERARIGRRPVVDALIDLVQDKELAGITVTRALEGRSEHGRLRTSGIMELGEDLPLIVEIVDRTERIEPLLPELAMLVPSGVLTVTDARLYFPATTLRVRDVMVKPPAVAYPETPLAEVLPPLLEGRTRLVPVVSEAGILQGIITLGHLLRGVDPALAAHLLQMRTPTHVRTHLDRLVAEHTAREGMLTQPYTLAPDTLLDDAARYLTVQRVTSAPVIDASRRLVGMLGQHEIVSALVAPQATAAEDAMTAALHRSLLPGTGELLTAGMLADRNVPLIPESAPFARVVNALQAAPTRMVLVVAPDGRLSGFIDEHTVLERTVPAATGEQGAALRRFFAFSPKQVLSALQEHSASEFTAAALMRPAVPVVPADMPIADALAQMLQAQGSSAAAVTTEDGQPIGLLWRYAALRALVGG